MVVAGSPGIICQGARWSVTLDLKLANGFVPAASNTFNVLTYTSLTGAFATLQGNGHTYTPTYGATILTITKQ